MYYLGHSNNRFNLTHGAVTISAGNPGRRNRANALRRLSVC